MDSHLKWVIKSYKSNDNFIDRKRTKAQNFVLESTYLKI